MRVVAPDTQPIRGLASCECRPTPPPSTHLSGERTLATMPGTHRVVWSLVVWLAGCGTPAAEPKQPHPHWWGYDKDAGPATWGMQSEHYRSCASGRKQSPIDLDPAHAEHTKLKPLTVHYVPTTVIELDNGHTVEDKAPPGEWVEVDGVRYQLDQFHFHHPSEHTLNGQHFPLEIHLVHRSERGRLLVVGVLVADGAENAALRMAFERLPHGSDSAKVSMDPAALLPTDRRYLTYDGSLTTPPCTEGVTWIVLATSITATNEQLTRFSAMFPNNSRPTMPLNQRHVKTTE